MFVPGACGSLNWLFCPAVILHFIALFILCRILLIASISRQVLLLLTY